MSVWAQIRLIKITDILFTILLMAGFAFVLGSVAFVVYTHPKALLALLLLVIVRELVK